MTGDLADFLAARYDEAEALAKRATQGPWNAETYIDDDEPVGVEHLVSAPEEAHVVAGTGLGGDQAEADAAYIASVDPAHRLADIKLKRAILAEHATETSRVQVRALEEDIAAGKPLWWYEDEHQCVICGWFDAETGGCATVRQLGTEFTEHAAYKQEWRPE